MAKLIFRLDELGALDILCNPEKDRQKRRYLLKVLSKENMSSLDKMSNPVGPGCYVLREVRHRALPVSASISEVVDNKINSNNVLLTETELKDTVKRFSDVLQTELAAFFEDPYGGIEYDYLVDFCDSCSLQYKKTFPKNERLFIWLWLARYSEYLTATDRPFIENIFSSLAHKDGYSSDVAEVFDIEINIYRLVAFLHVHQKQYKEVTEAFFRMASMLKSNMFINVVDILALAKEESTFASSTKAIEHILQCLCRDLATRSDWLCGVEVICLVQYMHVIVLNSEGHLRRHG